LIGLASAVVILGASVAPFLAPPVVHFEQSRTAVYSTVGATWAEIDTVTRALIGDLLFWTGDFDVKGFGPSRPGPDAVLSDAERAHMRDVRNVFTGFWLLVIAGAAILVVGFRRARATGASAAAWHAVSNGARGLAIAIAVAGAFALVAFDAAFELFHRLFFSAGTYTFNPARDRLVQLFPERFWSEISLAAGGVALVAAVVVAWFASRRAKRFEAAA
jgi:integral membrane protein (TIGR01906 family)